MRLGRSCSCGAFVGLLVTLWVPIAHAIPGITYFVGMRPKTISADGRRIVGEYANRPAYCEAVPNARPVILPLLQGTLGGTAYGISGNGLVIVGASNLTGDVQRAWLWKTDLGTIELPDFPGGPAVGDAMGASYDGRVIVGSGRQSHVLPARWQTPYSVVENMGTLSIPEYTSGVALGVSSDGRTVAITAYSSTAAIFQASIWRENEGLLGLGYLSDQFTFSHAQAISADGRVVVGINKVAALGSHLVAFRWDALSGQVPLGNFLPEPSSASPSGVNGDGSVIVGAAQLDPPSDDHPPVPFIWTPAAGMRPLEQVMVRDLRISLGTNRHLLTVDGISSDGRLIVGMASNGNTAPLMYLARLDPYCVADVDDGSGTGTRDDGVTIDDLLLYLRWFELGSIRADVDNGTFTGTRDAGVSIDDLLYFLTRYAAGC